MVLDKLSKATFFAPLMLGAVIGAAMMSYVPSSSEVVDFGFPAGDVRRPYVPPLPSIRYSALLTFFFPWSGV